MSFECVNLLIIFVIDLFFFDLCLNLLVVLIIKLKLGYYYIVIRDWIDVKEMFN